MKSNNSYFSRILRNTGSNIYTFWSGIFLSISTSIFVTLRVEDKSYIDYYNKYLSVSFFVLAGLLCILLAEKNIEIENKIEDMGNELKKEIGDKGVITKNDKEKVKEGIIETQRKRLILSLAGIHFASLIGLILLF